MEDPAQLDRWEKLRGVGVAKRVLEGSFKLKLNIVSARGPVAHQRGGIMAGSSEVCRAALFAKDGFPSCDAFYRELGEQPGEGHRRCHLGLAAISVPVVVLAGEAPVAHLVASGFAATDLSGCPPPDPEQLAVDLRALDPGLVDPSALIRELPTVRGDRVRIIREILRAAALEIVEHADADARRQRGERGQSPGLFGIVGSSPQMREVFALLERVAPSEAPVLITGESGTGKELVARALHANGPRARGPFVAQSCGAISDEILESLLFGHVRGAFSGAVRGNEGLFASAEGGTLFLDEVAEMSQATQVKLLRVLSDRTFMPVGATSPRKADVRLVTATHRDLRAMVASGELREDLFYRLHVIPVHLPPLRERPGDLRLLVESFLQSVEGVPGRISDAAWRCLERHPWPGNVRELRAEIERWSVSAAGEAVVGPEHLSPALREVGGFRGELSGGEAAALAAAGEGSLEDAVAALERTILERGLERTSGNRTRLAKELSISRTTLNERIKKFDL